MSGVKGIRKVKTRWLISLEKGASPKVKLGDKVGKGMVLAVFHKKRNISVPMSDLTTKLGREKLAEMLKKEEGKRVEKGVEMFKLPGFFGKKVFWPRTGKFLGVDEFSNFVFEDEKSETGEVISPVMATVEELGSDKIILSFRAIEFRGKAMQEAKIWCESCLTELDNLAELDCNYEEGLVFRQSLDEVFLAKAEVCSVAGVVSIEGGDEVEVALPVLYLSKKDWELLAGMMDGEKRQMLLNTRLGRLLIVV
jgi:hypothetical protein